MAKDLSAITPEDFEPHGGEDFVLATQAGALTLKLIEVKRLGAALRQGGAFALTFQSAPGRSLPQAIYPVQHPDLGTLDLFVVPLGPKNGGNHYEVIFT